MHLGLVGSNLCSKAIEGVHVSNVIFKDSNQSTRVFDRKQAYGTPLYIVLTSSNSMRVFA